MQTFIDKWNQYFPGAEKPIVFYYTDDENDSEPAPVPERWRCLVCSLGPVRKGKALRFSARAISCDGGKRYAGYAQDFGIDIERFMSSGIPGESEGERFKKTPEIVARIMQQIPPFAAPGKYLVFKPIDSVTEGDKPVAALFFATPDVLSGIYTLASFDDDRCDAVIAPFSAGCGALVHFPYHESLKDRPRAVLGMLDASARTCVPADRMTIAVPWSMFLAMVENIDESFLITDEWSKIAKRIAKG